MASSGPSRSTALLPCRCRRWKGNDRLVYAKDFGGDENFHILSVKSDGTGAKDLTPFPKVWARIVDEREDHDDEIYVELNRRDPEVFDVFKLELASGKLTLLAQNPGKVTHGWPTTRGTFAWRRKPTA